MATFPAYACILLSGFTEKPDYGVLRTEMDGGLAKQRPRRSKPIVTRAVTIHVDTLIDKQAFDAWVRSDIDGGTGWFDWTDPLDGISKRTRIVKGDYQWSSPGLVWRAEAKIETLG